MLKQALPEHIAMKKVVGDFQRAMWQAMISVFPQVKVSGCQFHWCRAVWRKVQELGLVVPFSMDRGTHKVVKRASWRCPSCQQSTSETCSPTCRSEPQPPN